MSSYHNIMNNMRSNNWIWEKEKKGYWTNNRRIHIEHTGKIFHNGKSIYFPISKEIYDDPKGYALRFEYSGDGTTSYVVSNKWNSFEEQYCYRQKKLNRKRKQMASRRRNQCKENDFELEKEENRKN